MKYLTNVKGEELDTKEKAIQALVHTANYEQMLPEEVWCFDSECQKFNIDKSYFYPQEMCKECRDWGAQIYHYKDDNFEYKYPWRHC